MKLFATDKELHASSVGGRKRVTIRDTVLVGYSAAAQEELARGDICVSHSFFPDGTRCLTETPLGSDWLPGTECRVAGHTVIVDRLRARPPRAAKRGGARGRL